MQDKVFKDTTATKRVFQLRKRIRAVAGGTSASKTISILVWLIDYAQSTKGEIITVVSESIPHLKMGAIRDFKSIMESNGYWEEHRWNDTSRTYTFKDKSFIEFISFDKFGKAHGPRRDVLFLNEANNIPWLIVDQLITRTRKIVWMDWNPSEEFYFYTDMLPNRSDIDFITLTYKDNEALDEISVAEIESHKNNKNWWTVYGLGQLGAIESRIYKDWALIDDIPHEAQLVRYGLDFGYTNDPTAIVAVYKYNGGYIIDEICYQTGLLNKQIADILSNHPKAIVVADSAEPKSIAEIYSYGIPIVGVEKKRGETKSETFVKWSIGIVQGERISLTKRSLNIIKDYRNFLWMTDKHGKILNEPEHEHKHGPDAIAYALVSLINRKPKSTYQQPAYESPSLTSQV